MSKVAGMALVAMLVAPILAAAEPACLPRPVFVKNAYDEFPLLSLGYVDNVLTLCAHERALNPLLHKSLGCWTVNPRTGALGESTATGLPGRGRRVDIDAQGCVNGFCIAPIRPNENRPFLATSTNGTHAAILTRQILYIFDTSTKAKITEIELIKADDPDETNISNEPSGLLYNGTTLFVIGADAGPFIGAWIFEESGKRAGSVTTDANALNLFKGGYGILSSDKVALADAGLQHLITVTGANAAKRSTARKVSYAPCTEAQFDEWTLGKDEETGACKRALDAKYKPYVNMAPVELASGHIATTLSGPAQGQLALLNPATLTETRRLTLARCQ
jgi:hypothetical protein